MHTYRITFADGLTFTATARDREEAQEQAIDHFEGVGLAHSAIVSIRVVA